MQKLDIAVWVDGGLGKVIALSGVISKLRNQIAVSAYPEVFFNNPNVPRSLHFNHAYLFEDYLSTIKVFKEDPYLSTDYRFNNYHIARAFQNMLLGKDEKATIKPEIHLSESEDLEALKFKESVGEYVLMQISGGTSYYNPDNALSKTLKSRDWPIEYAQNFVVEFRKKYPSIKLVQVSLPTETQLKGVINLTSLNARQIFPLVKHCKSFVVIDSFLNHLSAAFEKKGVVLWGGTSPSRLGYEHNINMQCDIKDGSGCPCHKSDFYGHLGGKDTNCYYKYACMTHEPSTVLDQLSSIIEVNKDVR